MNSMRGYNGLILLEHFLQFPERRNQLIIGILSNHWILVLHLGQKLLGKIIDWFLGNLYKITFIKLPIQVPKINTIKQFKKSP